MSGVFGIGGGGLNILESAAIGAVSGGLGSAVEEAAQSVLQAAMGEGLTALGNQLGLSSSQISDVLSQAGFTSSQSAADTASSAGSQMGFSPTQQGQVASDAQNTTDAFSSMLSQTLEQSGGQGAVHGGKGMSVLQAIAYAMGKAMDSKIDDMSAKAQQLGDSQSGSSQYGQLTSEISADGQELSMMSSAVSNAIKSVGDAGSELAKKD